MIMTVDFQQEAVIRPAPEKGIDESDAGSDYNSSSNISVTSSKA